MDLKGSLIDTELRVYPSEKLATLICNLSSKEIPDNFLKFVKNKKNLDAKVTTNLFSNTNYSAQITSKDLLIINKVKKELDVSEYEKLNDNNIGPSVTSAEDDPLTNDIKEEKKSKEFENKERKEPFLTTSDLDWLHNYLQSKRKQDKSTPYLHELLQGADIEMPKNKIIKRNPDLEARCVKLRAQQDARDYRKMTKGVDNVRIRFPDDSIAYQLKQLNRQLIAIGQFVLSIFAGFLFGFKGVEWLVGPLDFGFKLLLGVMCALIIALAEIYFLAKKLNEELSVPETVQLGGPPKFVDTKNYTFEPTANVTKEHQD